MFLKCLWFHYVCATNCSDLIFLLFNCEFPFGWILKLEIELALEVSIFNSPSFIEIAQREILQTECEKVKIASEKFCAKAKGKFFSRFEAHTQDKSFVLFICISFHASSTFFFPSSHSFAII